MFLLRQSLQVGARLCNLYSAELRPGVRFGLGRSADTVGPSNVEMFWKVRLIAS